jgi:hypothetical protein
MGLHRFLVQNLQAFTGKIQAGLDVGLQPYQLIFQLPQPFGKTTTQLMQSLLDGALALTLYHFQHTFRLNQVQSAVLKCAQSEFAFFRNPTARMDKFAHDPLTDSGTAMARNLDDLFAREGPSVQKRQDNDFINGLTLLVLKHAHMRRM